MISQKRNHILSLLFYVFFLWLCFRKNWVVILDFTHCSSILLRSRPTSHHHIHPATPQLHRSWSPWGEWGTTPIPLLTDDHNFRFSPMLMYSLGRIIFREIYDHSLHFWNTVIEKNAIRRRSRPTKKPPTWNYNKRFCQNFGIDFCRRNVHIRHLRTNLCKRASSQKMILRSTNAFDFICKWGRRYGNALITIKNDWLVFNIVCMRARPSSLMSSICSSLALVFLNFWKSHETSIENLFKKVSIFLQMLYEGKTVI